jgi:hypothetical protein
MLLWCSWLQYFLRFQKFKACILVYLMEGSLKISMNTLFSSFHGFGDLPSHFSGSFLIIIYWTTSSVTQALQSLSPCANQLLCSFLFRFGTSHSGLERLAILHLFLPTSPCNINLQHSYTIALFLVSQEEQGQHY